MMKDYDAVGAWTKLFDIEHLDWIQRVVGFKTNDEFLGNEDLFYLDTFIESLVLLNEVDIGLKEDAPIDKANGFSLLRGQCYW